MPAPFCLSRYASSAGTLYHEYDALGSTQGLLNDAAAEADCWVYRAYGLQTQTAGTDANNLTFVGRQGYVRDSEAELYLLDARYYDPATGQFLTVDPLLDVTGQPYAYAADNPVNVTDPWGLCDWYTPWTCDAGDVTHGVANAANSAEQAGLRDIVITADIPLAARCLEKDARVIDPRGNPFSESDIGSALAMRELMADLRQEGTVTGGPPPMTPKDRSRFLSKLDEVVNAVRRSDAP